MKNVKKIMSIALAGILSMALLSGCKKETATTGQAVKNSSDKMTIGVAIADFSDQFQVYVMDGMKAKASELGVEVVYMDGKYDAQKQMSQVENLISQKVDAIVLFSVDSDAGKKMADEIGKANIPLIAVNRPIESDAVISFVGSNDVEAGEIQAKEMARLTNGKANIGVIAGTYGHQPQIQRTEGYKNIIKDNPDMKIVVENTGDWYRDKGMKLMENWIQSNPDVNAILSNNDEMALGAVKAIEDAGLAGKITVAGIDATPEALEYVKSGKLAYTVFQDANGQGAKSIEIAVAAAKGEKVEKQYMIPFELVTKEKVDEYLARYKK